MTQRTKYLPRLFDKTQKLIRAMHTIVNMSNNAYGQNEVEIREQWARLSIELAWRKHTHQYGQGKNTRTTWHKHGKDLHTIGGRLGGSCAHRGAWMATQCAQIGA